jgi:hypothetical protein
MSTTTTPQTLTEAAAARDAVIDRAARGESVERQELHAAEEAVRRAEIDATHDAAVGRAAKARNERAQIVELQATTDKLVAEYDAAVTADVEAAKAADIALLAAREAAKRRGETFSAVCDAGDAMREHNGLVMALAATNAIMAALPPGHLPKGRTPEGLIRGAPLRVELVQTVHAPRPEFVGAHDVVLVHSIETIVRNAHGRHAPLPTADAAA